MRATTFSSRLGFSLPGFRPVVFPEQGYRRAFHLLQCIKLLPDLDRVCQHEARRHITDAVIEAERQIESRYFGRAETVH